MKKYHLTHAQRYTISAMRAQGCTQKFIAETVGRDKSVIGRELKRNANPKTGKYSFSVACELSDARKERMKKTRKRIPELKKKIISMIEEDRSPQQIEGRLKLEKQPSVSHETVYRIIRADKMNRGTLYRHCWHRLKHRKRPVGANILNLKKIHYLCSVIWNKKEMKILAAILCIYILTVSAIPCCHEDGSFGYCHTEQQANHTDSHSDCSGACSPFCLCNSCGGFTVMFLADDLQTVPQDLSDTHISFVSSTYLSPSLKGIWQPPRT